MKRPAWLTNQRIFIGMGILSIIFLLYQWDGSGFGESYDKNSLTVTEKTTETSQQGSKTTTKWTITDKREPSKTLWDWAGLLLAPGMLLYLGYWFQSSQDKAKEDKETADNLAAADQQREAALQNYLNSLSELLVDKRLIQLLSKTTEPQQKASDPVTKDVITETDTAKAGTSIDAEAALDVVKARSLSLLRLFDKDIPRKASLLSFLGNTNLLQKLNLNLSGTDLTLANLTEANLSETNLSETNLSGANLSNANLIEANLSGANLSKANLSKANLSKANLSEADLSETNLSGANLSGADLSEADLSKANLSGANLSIADLHGSDLSGARLFSADLHGANLKGITLGNANFLTANLDNAILYNCDLKEAQFSGTNLENANLSGANLINANLSGAILSRANLSGANLSGANLSGAIFLATDLTMCRGLEENQLTTAEDPPLLCATKLPADLQHLNLSDRDCDRLPQVLLSKRYLYRFNTLKEAKQHVDELRKTSKGA